MTVRVGMMTFADWVSLPMRNQFTDTFIFRISAWACLPPFEYASLLERIVAHVRKKRFCASLWVQVESPGDWFVLEVQRSLRGLRMPFAVSHFEDTIQYDDFSYPPTLLPSSLHPPPKVDLSLPILRRDEMQCLQVLGRMEQGSKEEIASLTALSICSIRDILSAFQKRKWIVETSFKRKGDNPKPGQLALFPSWRLTRSGRFVALRSWGVPVGIDFSSRLEEHRTQMGTEHRYMARLWPAWLRAAYPQVEIWTGWSEVRVPEMTVIPDALAWGRMDGCEMVFWLEAGDEHKSRAKITEITSIRLKQALAFCRRTGVRLVYAQLSPRWVHDAARWACVNLPPDVAVVMGDQRYFGKLPVVEWGKVNR